MTQQFKARAANWRERADKLRSPVACDPFESSVRADLYDQVADELDYLADNYHPARGERMPETSERFDYMHKMYDAALTEANEENSKLRAALNQCEQSRKKSRKRVLELEDQIPKLRDWLVNARAGEASAQRKCAKATDDLHKLRNVCTNMLGEWMAQENADVLRMLFPELLAHPTSQPTE